MMRQNYVSLFHNQEVRAEGNTGPPVFWRLVSRLATRSIPVIFLAALMLTSPSLSPAASPPAPIWTISVTVAPPPLIVYEQPFCPGPGYIWTPGYWAWTDDGGYFWVPGTWVLAPYEGALWTPGFWDWDGDEDAYVWYDGYWGPEVGFYGGVVYGFGYTGFGYDGGYWRGGGFYYNTAVNRVNTTNITNVYNRTVVNNPPLENVSFHGGNGGTTAQPTATELAAARQRHTPPTSVQSQQLSMARSNRAQFASVNHGLPTVAATPKPAAFNSSGVVRPNPSAAANKIVASRIAQIGPATRNAKPTITMPRPEVNGHGNTPTPGGSAPNTTPLVRNGRNAQPSVNPPRHAPQGQPMPREAPQRQPAPHTAAPHKPIPHSQNESHPLAQQRNEAPAKRALQVVRTQRTEPPRRSMAYPAAPAGPNPSPHAKPRPDESHPRALRSGEPLRTSPAQTARLQRNDPPQSLARYNENQQSRLGGQRRSQLSPTSIARPAPARAMPQPQATPHHGVAQHHDTPHPPQGGR